MKNAIIWLLELYRKYMSFNKMRCCRYYPSCSEYAINAIEKHGLLIGSLKSAVRVIKCNPLSKGGYDPA